VREELLSFQKENMSLSTSLRSTETILKRVEVELNERCGSVVCVEEGEKKKEEGKGKEEKNKITFLFPFS
jgi:hypothetical protein